MNTARNPDESQEDYRKRLREGEAEIQLKLKGKVLWKPEQGTYVKPKDETPEKPKLANQEPVYGVGEAGGGQSGDDTYAGVTDTEPMYYKEAPEQK